MIEAKQEYKFDQSVSVMLPKKQKFKLIKNIYPPSGISGKEIIHKLYNSDYFIIINHEEKNLQKSIENKMRDIPLPAFKIKPIITKIILNNRSLYFSDNLIDKVDFYGSPVYFILFEGKNNTTYNIGITLGLGNNEPEDYYLTAKKILFSVKMK